MGILEENNIMLDIETMGNGSNSAIVAIGAVKFGEKVTGKFYRVVTLESSISEGLQVDADTVMWWLRQSANARAEFSKPSTHLASALIDFLTWCDKAPIIWGNGATFDNVILSNAYKACGIKRPWSHRDDMCYRTLKNLHPGIELIRQGTHHNAVDDAESQANHLIRILKEDYT